MSTISFAWIYRIYIDRSFILRCRNTNSHPTDKSEDTLESGSSGKDLVFWLWRCFTFVRKRPLEHMGIFRNGETMARGKVIDALACYYLGKCHVHSRPDDNSYSLNAVCKLFHVNSERFNLVKLGLFIIGFFGYKLG